ncbi:MBOAT family O-acyltransferase [Sunxiuqinia indica]|uniref:MBOAT family O-acyltransferase n=1 Tax=Sunxiuqinia indica TaxID=2692584 RepID=UPI00135A6E3E|nr:MBOAT family protein [Sunxiuqinia indica]
MIERIKYIVGNIWQYRPDEPLFYTGIAFWIAFTLVLAVYTFVYKRNQIRNSYLLLVSWFFYFQMSGAFLSLLIFSCAMNYGFGLLIHKQRRKQVWVGIAIGLNLLILGYFKYAYFFLDNVNLFFETNFKVFNWIGWLINQLARDVVDVNSILLPIGISFYTFQAISYLVDVYRGDAEVVKNPLDFSFYLSFFPQLVAGPIVRASSFIPQLYQRFRLKKEEFSHSVFLIVKGLFKKLVIADFLALNFIDRVFEAPLAYSGLENLLSVYAYSIQIYCDFSGYTDIAIGLALLLGFKIPVNFNAPYQAYSLTDFWRRWHISLSLWLRDYLYIPLGGNRKGSARMYINLLITMILGGLWHGANIRFLIWGAIHGIGLVVEKFFRRIFSLQTKPKKWKRLFSVFMTFQVVSIAWIFFRARDYSIVQQLLYQIRHHFMPRDLAGGWESYHWVIFVFIIGLVTIWFPDPVKERIRGKFIRLPSWGQIPVILIILFLITLVAHSTLQPFIYFRF